MNPEAMKPYGLALSDYDKGNVSATLIIYRDDGRRDELPMSTFFRQPQEYELERTALDLCYGHVLDVGAGAGIHTLFLQERGSLVCAIDVSPEAVQIMQKRGVLDVRQADILSFEDGEFDTVIMMGHGIGVVENIRGLVSFLEYVPGLLKTNGQILLTSLDIRVTNDPTHLEYQKENLNSGRYFGEIRMQFEYRNMRGSLFGWLHIDAETLSSYASKTGWNCEVVQQQPDGNYLARLTKRHRQWSLWTRTTHLGVLSLPPAVYFPRVFPSNLTVSGSRAVHASALSFSYPTKLFQDSLAVGDTSGNFVQ